MSQGSVPSAAEPTVAFGVRLANSPAFKDLFRDGMALVEETAAYLDGPGRAESRALDRGPALAYATESMRLTTRLMQLASWLLLQRAVNEGELTQEQAAQEKSKVRLSSVGAPTPQATLDELPGALSALIGKAMRLQARIVHMDRLLFGSFEPVETVPSNSVAGQINRLASAFATKG
ncbi:protease adaptor protein RcdA [Phreatobacter sp.]|uniref:protease adaptor protein RcdA n=1 Tax=Phreatobacter sp. TaxID=1966341 RepID=UPI003F70732F